MQRYGKRSELNVMSQSSSSTPSRSTQDDRENQLEPFSDSLIEQDLNSSAINSSFNIKSNYNYSPNKSHKKCNHCEKIYRSTTATTNLRKHLLTKHPEGQENLQQTIIFI
ncbi:unnamed protein product [Gordionus sp. m RMFG-2023]